LRGRLRLNWRSDLSGGVAVDETTERMCVSSLRTSSLKVIEAAAQHPLEAPSFLFSLSDVRWHVVDLDRPPEGRWKHVSQCTGAISRACCHWSPTCSAVGRSRPLRRAFSRFSPRAQLATWQRGQPAPGAGQLSWGPRAAAAPPTCAFRRAYNLGSPVRTRGRAQARECAQAPRGLAE
jgi:hypothetical protein